ncbi:MAG: hypothetical protein ACR2NH_06930 [Solirubrobacteraceae bacterium]
MRRAARALLLAAVLAAAAAGCGNDRVKPASAPAGEAPEGNHQSDFPGQGVRLFRPENWEEVLGTAPQLVTIRSGQSTIAVWRYPRKGEQLPTTVAEFERARRAFVEAARARDRKLTFESVKFVRISGVPGIEAIATERIQGRVRKVRSTHFYAQGAEVVIDAYAPQRDFRTVNRTVFEPLVQSVKIERPRGS